MSFKVVQTVNNLSVSTGVSTSVPIELNSGYLKLTPTVGCSVATGNSPTASSNDFYIPANESEVLKERVARQKISGITTGATTIVSFSQNSSNPFLVGDYVTISNASPSGINTSHNLISAISEDPLTGIVSLTINYNSSSVTGVTVNNAYLARSVKVSGLGVSSGLLHITEVQITS